MITLTSHLPPNPSGTWGDPDPILRTTINAGQPTVTGQK